MLYPLSFAKVTFIMLILLHDIILFRFLLLFIPFVSYYAFAGSLIANNCFTLALYTLYKCTYMYLCVDDLTTDHLGSLREPLYCLADIYNLFRVLLAFIIMPACMNVVMYMYTYVRPVYL